MQRTHCKGANSAASIVLAGSLMIAASPVWGGEVDRSWPAMQIGDWPYLLCGLCALILAGLTVRFLASTNPLPPPVFEIGLTSLWTRVLSTLVLAPVVFGVIWIGGWWFNILLVLLLGLAAIELIQMMRPAGYAPPWFFAFAMIIILVADPLFPEIHLLRPALTFVLLAALTCQLGRRQQKPVENWSLAVVGGLYLGLAGAHFVLLRQLDSGERWLSLTLLGTWAADTSAYVIGSRLGRHKIAPLLSPKKSWEGLLGGIVFGPLLTVIAAALLGLPLIHGAVLGLIGAIFGLIGDLSISMIKRQFGVKDSGKVIPGHGGVLDRFDSLLFSVVVGFYYVVGIGQVLL